MVQERMIITDVARMNSGACIAGYSVDLKRSIRPVLAQGGGIDWSKILMNDDLPLEPLSVIDIELDQPRPDPPHCEDVVLSEPVAIRYLGRVPKGKKSTALNRVTVNDLATSFGTEVISDRYLYPGTGDRSLVTVRVQNVSFISIDAHHVNQTIRVRMAFDDAGGGSYKLPVTDVGLCCECYHRLANLNQRPAQVGARIRTALNDSSELYVRVGASRPFQPNEQHEPVCYLLVTGVYSIPDYRQTPWERCFNEDRTPVDWNILPSEVVERLEARS